MGAAGRDLPPPTRARAPQASRVPGCGPVGASGDYTHGSGSGRRAAAGGAAERADKASEDRRRTGRQEGRRQRREGGEKFIPGDTSPGRGGGAAPSRRLLTPRGWDMRRGAAARG